MKLAAVVVTYNRKEELRKNLDSMLGQTRVVDRLYIIDNHSSDGTEDFLRTSGYLDNSLIEYIYMYENTGGAGGFSYGVQKAYEDGYDLICLMDDDGRPEDRNTIQRLVDEAEAVSRKNKMFILNSLVCQDNEKLSFGLAGVNTRTNANRIAKEHIIEGVIDPFNGTLVSRELVTLIGFPKKEFFICNDEVEYRTRAEKAGAYIATVEDSFYYHPGQSAVVVKFFGKSIWGRVCSPWQNYYKIRNYTYMCKSNGEVKKSFNQLFKILYINIARGDSKMKSIRMICRGWLDGYKGKLGKTVLPGQ